MYQSRNSALILTNVTSDVTVTEATPESESTATPVNTVCVRPDNVRSDSRASARSAGLPMIRPSMTTVVSAATTTSPGRATSVALPRASRLT